MFDENESNPDVLVVPNKHKITKNVIMKNHLESRGY